MGWLKQPYTTLNYDSDLRVTETLLLSKLEGLGIQAHSTHRPDGGAFIVANCLTLCLDMGLWRCWSDKVEIDLIAAGPTGTRVTVAATPNLLRRGVRAGERLTDRATLLKALQPR